MIGHGRRTGQNLPVEEEAESHADGTDTGWENLSCNNVACDGVTHGPTDSVDVDDDNGENASTFNTWLANVDGWVCNADEHSQVQHGCGLHGSSNHERDSATNSVDQEGDIPESCNKLDDAVDTCGEKCRAVASNADGLENIRGKVVDCVSSGTLVEEEQSESETKTSSVAGGVPDFLENGNV